MPASQNEVVALYSDATDHQIMWRRASAMLHLCMTRGWSPEIACRTVDDVSAVLASGAVRTVVAVAPTPGLVEAVTARGGHLEVVRQGAAGTTAPAGLVAALGGMVQSGRLTPDEAAVLLQAAGPGREVADGMHRRPQRPA